ncbi:MAG: hypothetical protein HYU41_03915 [Candidatus Rokubacteria bacterium]|nr:hypothetical protein [Candidatus Rokubacteria bacterium]
MRHSRLLTLAMGTAALLTTGCVGAAELVRALGQDPASVCVSVTTLYGKGAACRVGGAVDVKAGDGSVSVTSK